MSFTYESDNQRDNEQKKFQPDSVGNTAVNVKGVVLDQILAALGGSSNTVPTIFNVPCATAGTEYSQALPAGTKAFVLKARKGSKVLFAYQTGAAQFLTINSGFSFEDRNFYSNQTVYFKASKDDEVIEIVAYV